jgi:hypothetical protein
MIVFVEKISKEDVTKLFNDLGFDSSADINTYSRYVNTIYDKLNHRATKKLVADVLIDIYKKSRQGTSLLPISPRSTTVSSQEPFDRIEVKGSTVWHHLKSDSSPNSYEATPGITKLLYTLEMWNIVWGGYQLNAYEKDIIAFMQTNNHNKMNLIRQKAAFRKISDKLISQAHKISKLYRIEDTLRFRKVGDIVDFDLRSFSPMSFSFVKFTKNPQYKVTYKVLGIKGINIGQYTDWTGQNIAEMEFLCSGRCKITSIVQDDKKVQEITLNGKEYLIEAKCL